MYLSGLDVMSLYYKLMQLVFSRYLPWWLDEWGWFFWSGCLYHEWNDVYAQIWLKYIFYKYLNCKWRKFAKADGYIFRCYWQISKIRLAERVYIIRAIGKLHVKTTCMQWKYRKNLVILNEELPYMINTFRISVIFCHFL